MKSEKSAYVQDFFILDAGTQVDDKAEYRCRLRPDSPVFSVHFPGHPVLPGVLLLKLVVDALNAHHGFAPRRLELTEVVNAKYLAVVDPRETTRLTVDVERRGVDADGSHRFRATVRDEARRFATFSFACAEAAAAAPADLPRDVCAVIPTYNNGATVLDVVRRARRVVATVIVVDDGSTDATARLLRDAPAEARPDVVLTHPRNRGKGAALRTGLGHARDAGFRYAVTIDADGQHDPADVPAMLAPLADVPDALVVGSRGLVHDNMPGASTFANRFSNFWFAVQTWRRLPDTQTGLRVYPLRRLVGLRRLTSRYEAELLLLVLAAWHGVPLLAVPVSVSYPAPEERVSHFRPLRDFGRISVLNTVLCAAAVVYGWPRLLFSRLRRLCCS